MIKINGRIICVFEVVGKGPLCRNPSDEGPFVALDRRNAITPVFRQGYSRPYVVKIQTTSMTGKIRFGEILSITLKDFFTPLRQKIHEKMADAVWDDGCIGGDGKKRYRARLEFVFQGLTYVYKLVRHPEGGINATPEGMWFHFQEQGEASFEFTSAEIAELAK